VRGRDWKRAIWVWRSSMSIFHVFYFLIEVNEHVNEGGPEKAFKVVIG
jgi:hypothetical protein